MSILATLLNDILDLMGNLIEEMTIDIDVRIVEWLGKGKKFLLLSKIVKE